MNCRLRLIIAARTRIAEDTLAAAIQSGVTQLVVLGAGLDTFAYRNPFRHRLRVFEVDHPDTQAYKRDCLDRAQIRIPDCLTFAPVDFERETLAGGLAAAGFASQEQSFFTWLGVVPYLTEAAIWSTLQYLAELPGGAHVVFDYGNPPESLGPENRARHDELATRVAVIGEPWLTFFDEEQLHPRLRALGFSHIEDWGPPQIAARFFPNHTTSAPDKGGHVLHAATRA